MSEGRLVSRADLEWLREEAIVSMDYVDRDTIVGADESAAAARSRERAVAIFDLLIAERSAEVTT